MDIEQLTLTIATGVALMMFLPVLPQFVNLFPKLWSGLFRTATFIRIEDSKKVQRGRDLVFWLSLPALVTLVWKSGLYSPSWTAGLDAPLNLAAVAGVIAGYGLLRAGLSHLLPFRRFSSKVREAAVGCPKNFWLLLVSVLFLSAVTMGFCKLPENTSRIITLCLTGALYLLFLIRRFQIFAHDSNYLTAILYLCALEILPTALLVTSAVVF